MADSINGSTQMDATKQAAIAEKVQRELKAKAKLAGTVLDVSSFAQPGLKSISFPKLGAMTISNRASGVAGDSQQVSATVDTLNLNQNAYCAWIIDAMDALQSTVKWQAALAVKAAAAHGRYVDTQILSELATVATETTTVGSLTKDVVIELRKKMVDAFVDPEECFLVCSSTEYAAILGVADFISADKYGSSALPSGVVGKVLGLNVIEHPGLASGYYCYHPEALALGFQAAPNMKSQPANEFGTNSERVAMDQLFGVKGLQIAENGAAAGKSALAFKYNDGIA